MPSIEAWPPLPYDEWEPTKQTLHRYVQIVGKVRMDLTPPRNHWWHVTLYVTPVGLTTGPMPAGERDIAITFDFLDHALVVRRSDGQVRRMRLGERPACADFYEELMMVLADLDVEVDILPRPFDLPDSPPFAEDRVNASYDAGAVERFWRVLAATQRVLMRFTSSFSGKQSPIHLYWHSFDIAQARFSGRAVDVGDVDPVSAEAYSHEVIAVGFWPGDNRRTPFPAFYSYTAPEPEGLRERGLDGPGSEWQDTGNGSLAILPYENVRLAGDPEGELLSFFLSAYDAGSTLGGWDREGLAAAPR